MGDYRPLVHDHATALKEDGFLAFHLGAELAINRRHFLVKVESSGFQGGMKA
jgi:hypothetical protein